MGIIGVICPTGGLMPKKKKKNIKKLSEYISNIKLIDT